MLSDTDRTNLLDEVNEVSPDTFDEGPLGPWKFTDVARSGSTWTLSFVNREGKGAISFEYDGAAFDEDGLVSEGWSEQLNDAVATYEEEGVTEA
jgi:hypothetical protein